MMRHVMAVMVASGLTFAAGCGEQAKPIGTSNVAKPVEDSGMGAGAPKPGDVKVGGRGIPGEKQK